MTYLRTGLTLTTTLALSAISHPPAFAQEGPGLTGTLSYSQGFEWSDNEDLSSATSGSTLTSRTGLRFGVQSRTRAETFSVRLGTALVGQEGGGADGSFNFENNTARMDYERRGASSALNFSARYSEGNLDDRTFAPDPENAPDTFVIDSGSLASTSLNAGLEFGIDAPFGVHLDAGYRNRNYSGTSDPDLTDLERVSVDALARFRLTPTRAVRGLAGYATENEEGVAVDTNTTYVGVGFEDATAGGLSYSADILFDRVETGMTENGVGIDLAMTQTRPGGDFGVDVTSRIDEDGRRTEASVRQSFELPTGGLAYSLGVVDLEGDSSLRPRGALTYSRDLKTAAISARLALEPSSDGTTVTNDAEIALDYSRVINSSAGWSAALSYRVADEVGSSADDERAAARITYTHSLTDEWEMNAGVEHVREIDGGGPTESSNTVFFNIQRDITFGF